MAERTGITDAIRAVLREADDSLQIRQVADLLERRGIVRADSALRPIFREREGAGEFLRAEIAGNVCYTINPEFVPKRGGPRRRAAGLRDAVHETLLSATRPLTLAELVQRLDAKQVPHAGQNSISSTLRAGVLQGHFQRYDDQQPARWGLADRSPPDAGTGDDDTPAAVASTATTPPQAEQVPASGSSMPPHALRDRLSAIVQDLEDALADACRAELPHSLIGHLASANQAAHRAARELGG